MLNNVDHGFVRVRGRNFSMNGKRENSNGSRIKADFGISRMKCGMQMERGLKLILGFRG
jgi:hypothetical protein